jgi:excisionase family DNA binding protein
MPVKRRSFLASSVPPAALPEVSLSPRLLPIPKCAEYLSCSTWTVRDLIRRNELRKIRLGKKFLIDRADLNEFIERQKAAA